MTKFHTDAAGYWMKCSASVREGQGVTNCPIEVEGVEVRHTLGLAGIAAAGGGTMRRWVDEGTYRETKIIPNGDGTFTTDTGKTKRVYTTEGKLIPHRQRVQAEKDEARQREAREIAAAYELPSYVAVTDSLGPLFEQLTQLDQASTSASREALKPTIEDVARRLAALKADEDAWRVREEAGSWITSLVLTIKEVGYDNGYTRKIMNLTNL